MGPKQVPDLLSQQIDEELIVFNKAKAEGHTLNHAAALVFDLCDGNTTRAAMAAAVSNQLGLPADPDVVELALAELRDAGLVTDDAVQPAVINRRSVIRKLGLSVMTAAALPLVETMVMRPAHAQLSGPTGSTGPTGPTGSTGPTGPTGPP
jgi:coenzyme PQQ synthesis protein D (PqqD)